MAEPLVVGDLPAYLAYDCGALIRALGAKPEDPRTPKCQALWAACRSRQVQVMVPAMVFAEMVRGGPERPPHDRLTAVYPFDEEAALFLGLHFKEQFIRDLASTEERPIHYVKYDALIISCVARHHAGGIVSLDRRFRALAKKVGLLAYDVDDLVSAPTPPPAGSQVSLFDIQRAEIGLVKS